MGDRGGERKASEGKGKVKGGGVQVEGVKENNNLDSKLRILVRILKNQLFFLPF